MCHAGRYGEFAKLRYHATRRNHSFQWPSRYYLPVSGSRKRGIQDREEQIRRDGRDVLNEHYGICVWVLGSIELVTG